MQDNSESSESIQIKVQHHFDATAEPVFDAWLDPVNLGKWLFRTPTGQLVKAEVDPRVGGEFTITEQRTDILAEHFGTYVTIERPHKLAFAFRTDTSSEPTLVTVEISSASSANGCDLVLSHNMDPKWADFADRARGGWTMLLQQLASMLNSSNAATGK